MRSGQADKQSQSSNKQRVKAGSNDQTREKVNTEERSELITVEKSRLCNESVNELSLNACMCEQCCQLLSTQSS